MPKKNISHKFYCRDAANFKLNYLFGGAISIGLYHHLSDRDTIRSIKNVLTHLKRNSFFMLSMQYIQKNLIKIFLAL
jgi:hypothetical protein